MPEVVNMESPPTQEEWQVILSALKMSNPNSPLEQTITDSALNLVNSYMDDNIMVETAFNDGTITIRGFGIPENILNEME